MSAYYSTEESIKRKVMAYKITLWGDKDNDGTLDPDALTQALSWARSNIDVMCLRRYGSQVLGWDSDTVPTLLSHVSDDYTVYYLASGNNALNPIVQINYETSKVTLAMIKDGEIDLPNISGYDEDILTETMDSVFDDFQSRYGGKDRGVFDETYN